MARKPLGLPPHCSQMEVQEHPLLLPTGRYHLQQPLRK